MQISESEANIVDKPSRPRWTVLEIGLTVTTAVLAVALVVFIALLGTRKGLLEEAAGSGDRDAVTKAKRLYLSCMDEEAIEERDSEPLLWLLEDVLEWPVATVDWNSTYGSQWRLEEVLAFMTSRYGNRVIIDVGIASDVNDSKSSAIYIDQPSLGLPTRDFYFDKGYYSQVRDTYLRAMIAVATIIRADKNITDDIDFVQEQMEGVFRLEMEIAEAITPAENRTDVTKLFNRMTLLQLQQEFPLNGFNWTLFINEVLKTVDIEVEASEEILVSAPEYLEQLSDILNSHPPSDVHNYVVWMLITEVIGSLSHKYQEAIAETQKMLYGVLLARARWRHCVDYVNTALPSAVGALYVLDAFPRHGKTKVEMMIERLREAFIHTLDEMTWMDDRTRARAREKVLSCAAIQQHHPRPSCIGLPQRDASLALAITTQMGYADYIVDGNNPRLDEEYADLNYEEDVYFENTLQDLEFAVKNELKRLRRTTSKQEWDIGPATINAFYHPSKNQIVFPAGILQPPFFGLGQAMSLNFGGIGMVIGHEITHGFDNFGRKFNKEGNLVDWWTAESDEDFDSRSRCLVSQYSSYTWDLASGQNISGVKTLGENIADNGGVRQAYWAYRRWVEEHGEEARLPGLALNHKQLFFLNFAQVWCGLHRPEFASSMIKADVHSPGLFSAALLYAGTHRSALHAMGNLHRSSNVRQGTHSGSCPCVARTDSAPGLQAGRSSVSRAEGVEGGGGVC
ncbi:membrane metallo-endopeptidase-like 1 isoform X5 [Petromyzon marinus]|uniref:membrane metallo-endopeptidase-like 1 isoform X5 n=1 Tax=Petromyzon marinus TaxID=7757 RepID=UPI003F723BE7